VRGNFLALAARDSNRSTRKMMSVAATSRAVSFVFAGL
jgi:hypothetical protein